MTIYSVHIRDTGAKPDLAIVQDGFSWGAAAFGFLWALYIGAWGTALALLAIQTVAGALIPLLIDHAGAQSMAHIGVAAAIGFGANELRRVMLGLRGLGEVGVVSGESVDDAERRYLDHHPDVTQRLLGAA